MKTIHLALVSALALVVSVPAWAQDMGNMAGMSMSGADQAVKTGRGIGVVKAMDPAAHTLTLKHGPIPAIGWPAMTMTFKVDASASMSGLKVGQPVAFDVKAKGMSGEITALRPQS